MNIRNILFLLIAGCLTNFSAAQEVAGQNTEPRVLSELSPGFSGLSPMYTVSENAGKGKYGGNRGRPAGLVFSFSGFSEFGGFDEFRLGMGMFFGDSTGLLFEFDLKKNIKYTRLYYHLTGDIGVTLLAGGSMVVGYDNNTINTGFAPEAGISLSRLFKIFYRYNFYINDKKFNGQELVFHLCL
ncbi:MAG: hypothetical protein LBF63_09015 [Treponema sp.]|jgi:hypothetical protein|nr:hypothetical protein [Treponema sp.]